MQLVDMHRDDRLLRQETESSCTLQRRQCRVHFFFGRCVLTDTLHLCLGQLSLASLRGR